MVSKISSSTGLYTPFKELELPYYKMTKPNKQHQLDLLYVPDNVFEGNIYIY